MTWFKVDDGLHAHKKAVRAGVPAMGLWVLAGAWCADQLTDGWVPDYIAARLDPAYEEHASALVRAGLWVPGERFESVRANDSEHVRANDVERGWWFHEWERHQPSAQSVLAKRDEAKERMARLREARRATNSAGQSASKQSESVRANTERTSREVRSAPTRPDPTRKEPSPHIPPEGGSAKRRTRVTDDDPAFSRFWDAYPRKVAKGTARRAWATATKTTNPEVIIQAAERYRDDPRREDRYTAHPSTWLNGERWTDQPPTPLRAVGSATGGAFWDN